MLMSDHFAKSGALLFRWRSFVLGGFLPFIAYAIYRGEIIEIQYGEVVGDLYELVCMAMIVGGLMLRAYTVGHVPDGTSGRNTHGQVAHSLNTTGAYSVMRNPLYFANALTYVGLALYPQTLFIGVAMVLVLVIYYERIIAAEEQFLVKTFGKTYTEWASNTPAFFPRLGKWKRPELAFDWRFMIRREHTTWFGAVVLLYLLELGTEIVEGEPLIELYGWHALLVSAIIAYLVIRFLRKKTDFFESARQV